jgi:DNA-binding transcriptional MerR regulator
VNDLRALHLIHSAIKYYQVFGASPEIRDELLTVASRATGSKPQTLSAAISTSKSELQNWKQAHDRMIKFPEVKVRLFTQDNPLAILGRIIKAMRNAGVAQDEIDTYIKQATSGGNLKNLLAVTAQWVSTYWGRAMTRDVQTLTRLDLLHRTITLHTVFGATDDTRERLLRITDELTGKKPATLTAALGQIEIQIARLRGEVRQWKTLVQSLL